MNLSPCPLCRGKRGKALLEQLQPDCKYDWRIRCYGCSLEVTPRIEVRGNKAKKEVIAMWEARDD